MLKTKKTTISLALLFLLLGSATTAGAVCLSNGHACGTPIAANDRLCCPGSICGPWGNVCQAGCRINGTAYRTGTLNPANACQACQPISSTTAWTNVPSGTSCNDNNRCTQTDRCQAGTCIGSNPLVCQPSDQCHVAGTCNPATGVCSNPNKTDGAACNDYNGCTQTSSCLSGSCVGANPVVCPTPPDVCHVQATCSPATGTCPSFPNAPDGTACNDGNPCTQTDACQGGSCAGSNEIQCPADPCGDPCHLAGTCNPGTGLCVRPDAPNGTPCSDGDICTLDACNAGVCTPGCPNSNYDHCANNVQDCGETGVDCGGSCPLVCGQCPGPCTSVACLGSTAFCGSSGPFDECTCSQNTEGICYCTETPVNGPQDCVASSDCPSGSQCIPYCAGVNLCSPPCGTNPFRSAAPARGANPTVRK